MKHQENSEQEKDKKKEISGKYWSNKRIWKKQIWGKSWTSKCLFKKVALGKF